MIEASRTTVRETGAGLPWWRRERWRYAGAAFFVGVCYSLTAMLVGLEVRLGGLDVALAVGLLLEVSFATFGYLLGLVVELRREERRAAAAAQIRLRELVEVRERLAQTEKLASLGQLASTVAHEVRNPLAILRSMTQNLAEELPSRDRKAQAVCRDLMEEIDRLASVTSRLVDFANPVTVRAERLELKGLSERVRQLARSALVDRRRVDIQLDGADGVDIEADGDLLCQVLLGLVENAVAASPPGGRITLGWRETASGVEVSVDDEGDGVPEDLRERVFEPFFTTRHEGHGLGLAVARHLVEVHGGTIRVEDSSKGGARFQIDMPRSKSLA